MEYKWEKALEPYTSEENIHELRRLVTKRREEGRRKKWCIIVADSLFVALVLFLIGILNILKTETGLRMGVINGVIAFKLAIVTFVSPIQGTSIRAEEVDRTVTAQVTGDIMDAIRETAEQGSTAIEKQLAFVGGCGVFAAVILQLIA